jgi:hypothetical protein
MMMIGVTCFLTPMAYDCNNQSYRVEIYSQLEPDNCPVSAGNRKTETNGIIQFHNGKTMGEQMARALHKITLREDLAKMNEGREP